MNSRGMMLLSIRKYKDKANFFRLCSGIWLSIALLCVILLLTTPVAGTAAGSDHSNITMDSVDELFDDDESLDSTMLTSVPDPLYNFNRAMFVFNDKFYFYLLKPAALGYQKVTPLCLRKGIRNFFYNALFPVRFVNNVLQAKFDRAFFEGKIFVINTVAGGLGFATTAQDYFNMHSYREDLGQTLGSYSIKEGCYIVLPILGASTLRDIVGKVGDSFLSPLTYVEPVELSMGLRAVGTVNATAFRIGDYEALKEAALDPYVALRDAYIQKRKKQVQE